jgi:hypothetical protein
MVPILFLYGLWAGIALVTILLATAIFRHDG